MSKRKQAKAEREAGLKLTHRSEWVKAQIVRSRQRYYDRFMAAYQERVRQEVAKICAQHQDEW